MDYKAEYERLKKLVEEVDGVVAQFCDKFDIQPDDETDTYSMMVSQEHGGITLSYNYDNALQSDQYVALQDLYIAGLELQTAFLADATTADDIPF